MPRPLMVSVIGAGVAEGEIAATARTVGRLLAEAQVTVVTGGLGGVMEEASRGAREAGGTTIGLLPGNDRSSANSWVTYPISTGLGDSRNALVAVAGAGVIAVGGSVGTLSELALALRRGLPVVSLHSWQLDRQRLPADSILIEAQDATEAVARLLEEIEPTQDGEVS